MPSGFSLLHLAGLYFEVGCNGGRYDLILSPEGDKKPHF